MIDSLNSFVSWLLLTSVKATFLSILIIFVQYLFQKKLAARWLYTLWFLLIARLLIPFEIPSPASIFNVLHNVESQSTYILFDDSRVDEKIETVHLFKQDFSPQVPDFATEIIEPQTQSRFSWFSMFCILWALVAFIITIFTLTKNIKIYLRMKLSKPITNKKIIALYNHCKIQMRVDRIELRTCQKIFHPLLFGIFSPRIIIPEILLYDLSLDELEHIFLHELAHYRRRDIPISLIVTVLQILHWFNPILWFAFYKLRLNREVACDELVLLKLEKSESIEYGNTLISLIRRSSDSYHRPLTVGIIDDKRGIKERLEMIARFKKISRWRIFAAVVLFVLIGIISMTDASNKKSVKRFKAEVGSGIELKLNEEKGHLPIAGKSYKIEFNPGEKNIFTTSTDIRVVYVFDYWNIVGTYSGGDTKLFENVLQPDPERVNEQKMNNEDSIYTANIFIPDSVSLISYYFTDGKLIDANDKKTYVDYIYGNNGKPVRGARFRNLDFMVMEGKSKKEQMNEIQGEIEEYPDNFMAYVPLWRMRFLETHKLYELITLQRQFEHQFNEFKKAYGYLNEYRLAEVSVYFNLLHSLNMFVWNAAREDREIIAIEIKNIMEKMITKIKQIPEDKRSIWIQQYYDWTVR